ncbi:MAG: hypothetical protein KDC38_13590, partial [Planctomycetes bacterium]|nr:hypothetical protein [Planctomycetota bacterium]
VHFDPKEMRRAVRRRVEDAVRNGKLPVKRGREWVEFYNQALSGYTYLEN